MNLLFQAFLTSTRDGAWWSGSRPGCFILEEISPIPSRIHRIGYWLDSTALKIRFPSQAGNRNRNLMSSYSQPRHWANTSLKGFRSKNSARYSTFQVSKPVFPYISFSFRLQKWIHAHTLIYINSLELWMYRTLCVFLNSRHRMSKRPRFNYMSPYCFSH